MGTRVAVPSGDSGQLLTGAIQAVKTCEDPSLANRFSVRLDSGRVVELLDSDLVGPGFKPVASVKLMPGQLVFVTHLQREMAGKVVRHDFESQDVIINLNDVSIKVIIKSIIIIMIIIGTMLRFFEEYLFINHL